MRKTILLIALLFCLCGVCYAQTDLVEEQSQMYRTDSLYDGLDEESKALLQGVSPTQTTTYAQTLSSIFSDALTGASSTFREAVRSICLILLVVILCASMQNLNGRFTPQICSFAGVLGIAAVCTQSVSSMMGLARELTDRIVNFCTLLLPVMTSTAVASGAAASGTVLFAGTSLFSTVLLRVMNAMLVPMVYCFTAISCADCACGESRLSKLRELIGWVISASLKIIMYGFTGYIAVTGLFSASADAAALKAAKTAFSTMLPVVGGIVSDAAESVLAGAKLLKSSVGVFGMLAILAIGIAPFVRIAMHYLAIRLAAAISGTVGGQNFGNLLSAFSSAMGYLLAIAGCAVLMALVSCVSFLKVGIT